MLHKQNHHIIQANHKYGEGEVEQLKCWGYIQKLHAYSQPYLDEYQRC